MRPSAAEVSPSSTSRPDGSAGVSIATASEVLYINVYDGGRIMDRAALEDFMRFDLGLSRLSSDRFEAMTPAAACQRMCANLAGIYSAQQEVEHLWSVLELLTSANPMVRDCFPIKHRRCFGMILSILS